MEDTRSVSWLTGRPGYLKISSKLLNVQNIEMDEAIYTRGLLRESIVHEYAAAMIGGAQFPNIAVFQEAEKGKYVLADGWHRIAAVKKCVGEKVRADVYRGTKKDAAIYGALAAVDAGIHRNIGDRRAAVRVLLDLGVIGEDCGSQAARALAVSINTVCDVIATKKKGLPEGAFKIADETFCGPQFFVAEEKPSSATLLDGVIGEELELDPVYPWT